MRSCIASVAVVLFAHVATAQPIGEGAFGIKIGEQPSAYGAVKDSSGFGFGSWTLADPPLAHHAFNGYRVLAAPSTGICAVSGTADLGDVTMEVARDRFLPVLHELRERYGDGAGAVWWDIGWPEAKLAVREIAQGKRTYADEIVGRWISPPDRLAPRVEKIEIRAWRGSRPSWSVIIDYFGDNWAACVKEIDRLWSRTL